METPFSETLVAAARKLPPDLRVEYTLSSGGVPPTVVRFALDASLTASAERIHAFPPPARTQRREGKVPAERVTALLAAFAGVEVEKLRGPVADSFNQWFTIAAGGAARTFSIVALRAPIPDPARPDSPGRVDPRYQRIMAAVDAVFAALGGL